MSTADSSVIMKRMTEIRRAKTGFFASNIYKMPEAAVQLENEEHAFAYMTNDRNVQRVFYAANDADALERVLGRFPEGSGIEIIDRELGESLETVLQACGYRRIYTYLRGKNASLKETLYDSIPSRFDGIDLSAYGRAAVPEDAENIYEYIHDVFDELADHLQTKDEVEDDIANGRYLVDYTGDTLTTIVKYDIQGKKVHMEYAANRGESAAGHALYLRGLENAVAAGVNVAYNWVRDNNFRSLNFCRRYGIVPDGTKNFVFQKG